MTTTAEKPMKFGVSTVICYDRHFSEGPRALALNCCDLMFVPTATAAGRSFFSGPTGDVVTRLGSEHDAILHCEIDTEVSAQLRDEWGFFRDRRPDAYGALVAP